MLQDLTLMLATSICSNGTVTQHPGAIHCDAAGKQSFCSWELHVGIAIGNRSVEPLPVKILNFKLAHV